MAVAAAGADEERRGDAEVKLRRADALGERERVEVLDERARAGGDDAALAPERDAVDQAERRLVPSLVDRGAELGQRLLPLVPHDGVDGGAGKEQLAEGEGRGNARPP